MLEALRKRPGLHGLIHGFTGSVQIARDYERCGFMPSLGVRSIQRRNPADFAWLKKSAFVIESDAPGYRSPSVDAEEVAESWMEDLNAVAAFLAQLWSMDLKDVWKMSDQNLSMIGLSQSS
jgi:Tat protein secretion system quality control protein TatD with DNase activity